MIVLYNIAILLYRIIIRIASIFNTKARLFLKGRGNIFDTIQDVLSGEKRNRIWIHCASLGEFEQARPLIEKIRTHHPNIAIILTFFSPSGYENQKTYPYVDYVFYLPIDTSSNAKQFVDLIKPQTVLFVKYEFWYHYLHGLYTQSIPVYLFSAIFQNRHPFFKWYGSLHRKMLGFYKHIFVQDDNSLQLLEGIGISNVSVTGDTRFDRVIAVTETIKQYPSIDIFKADKKLLIAGSTWVDDEKLLQQAYQAISDQYKLLIVPHEIDESHIKEIEKIFNYDCCMWDDDDSLANTNVAIVNAIGHLSYLYRYVDVAWVGGGFTVSGVHNVLEPAAFGCSIFWGANYKRYQEAIDMIDSNAAVSIINAEKLVTYIKEENLLEELAKNAKVYVEENAGATQKIYSYLLSEKCFFTTDKKF